MEEVRWNVGPQRLHPGGARLVRGHSRRCWVTGRLKRRGSALSLISLCSLIYKMGMEIPLPGVMVSGMGRVWFPIWYLCFLLNLWMASPAEVPGR